MIRMLVGLFVFGALCGCSSPTVRYGVATDNDFHGIKSGRIIFALRGSDATFCDTSSCGKWPQTAKIIPCKQTPLETIEQAWNGCVNSLAVVVTPTIDGQPTYLARPGNLNPFAHTKLASTFLNDDTANLETVTVAFSDNTSSVVSSIGAGAVAGLVFGPVGAIAGGVIAGAGAVATTQEAALLQQSSEPWRTLVCSEKGIDMDGYLALATKLPLQLSLPVVVNASKVANSDANSCWNALPESADSMISAASPSPTSSWSGWLYRVIAAKAPQGSLEVDKWADGFFDDSRRHDFPYVPCQDAEIQLVWWSELASHFADPSAVNPRVFKVEIANPKFVRLADLPKGGTIKLGAVCNAQVSFGSYAGSSAQATTDAALKAVSDYKAAQVKAQQAKAAQAKAAH